MKQWRISKMGRQPIILAIFPRKLHEIENKIGQRASPIPTPLDPPMWTDKDFVVKRAR